MVLKIKDFELPIDRFNLSVNHTLGQFNSYLELKILNIGDIDMDATASSIIENFEGSLSIINEDKTYNFTGYTFDSIDMFIDFESESIIIKFMK